MIQTRLLCTFLAMAVFPFAARAADAPATTSPVYSPAELPGNGLAAHPMLCFGENDRHRLEQTISVVRDGKVVWTYSIPMHEPGVQFQEIGTAFMRTNGNICFNRLRGASEITPDKKIVWNYDAPKGTEIHVVRPVGPGKVMMIISDVPTSRLMVIDQTTGAVEKQVDLPTPNKHPHLNFRRVHLTKTNTIIAAQMQENKVVEYDWAGKPVWTLQTPFPWSVVRLDNGNTLVTGNAREGTYVHEVNPTGDTIWSVTQKDLPDYKIQQFDDATRLANGNTLLINWCALGAPLKAWPEIVQALEVTPDKKVVWALRSWEPGADLGPLSGIEFLDVPKEQLDYQQ